ncbi:hypothetical protein GGI06_006606 [Coemansia sp. S85]|nr:hypothetical protein GGI06_006606 [Coemansia sp. S85]
MSLIDVGSVGPFEVNRSVGQSRTPVVQKFRSILEATTTFSLKGAVAAKYLLQALESTASAAVLHELRLYERPLCASKALSIISAIPSLVTLTSKINESVSDTKAIPPDEHLNALHVKYPCANISFRRLDALSDDSDDEDENGWSDDYDYDLDNMIYCLDCGLMRDECSCDYYFDIVRSSNGGKNVKDKPDLAKKVAAVAVQIAVLCPNFGHVVLPREVRGESSREVTLAMANGPFVPLANRLSCLIYQE